MDAVTLALAKAYTNSQRLAYETPGHTEYPDTFTVRPSDLGEDSKFISYIDDEHYSDENPIYMLNVTVSSIPDTDFEFWEFTEEDLAKDVLVTFSDGDFEETIRSRFVYFGEDDLTEDYPYVGYYLAMGDDILSYPDYCYVNIDDVPYFTCSGSDVETSFTISGANSFPPTVVPGEIHKIDPKWLPGAVGTVIHLVPINEELGVGGSGGVMAEIPESELAALNAALTALDPNILLDINPAASVVYEYIGESDPPDVTGYLHLNFYRSADNQAAFGQVPTLVDSHPCLYAVIEPSTGFVSDIGYISR